MKCPVSVPVTAAVEAVAHDLARGSLYGRDAAQAREGCFALQAIRVVPGQDEEGRCVVDADSGQAGEPPGRFRYEPLQLGVELGDLLRKRLVAAGYRAHGEPRSPFHVFGLPGGSEASRGGDELPRGQPAQAL